jgi:hypothetical protein
MGLAAHPAWRQRLQQGAHCDLDVGVTIVAGGACAIKASDAISVRKAARLHALARRSRSTAARVSACELDAAVQLFKSRCWTSDSTAQGHRTLADARRPARLQVACAFTVRVHDVVRTPANSATAGTCAPS